MESPLAIAVRAYTQRRRGEDEEFDSSFRGQWKLPGSMLVLDAETTTEYAQQLNFGSWRYYRLSWQNDRMSMACVEEGLFHADDLLERYPRGYRTLCRYVEKHSPQVDRSVPDAAWRLQLLSARDFTNEVLLRLGFRGHAWIVGFNLPFDLSRLAYDESESRDYLAGGFSLTLAQYLNKDGSWKENRWRSRLAIRTLDSKRRLMGFKRPKELDEADQVPEDGTKLEGRPFRGHFLDLRTLAFALTNEGYTLELAVQAFADPNYKEPKVKHGRITRRYIDYNRQDVRVTALLFEALMAEHRRHPIRLTPTRAYSPASVGKAYLRAMGVRPRKDTQPKFSREVLGKAMVAYHGGRTECRIRRTPVPVAYVDFLSMYPTVNSLMGLWDLVTAATVETDDSHALTGEVQRMLENLTLERCFDPATWPGLVGIAEIEPQGDILPVRARYGDNDSWGTGLNPLTSDTPIWYSLPDLVAAKVLGDRTPKVRRVIRFLPHGRIQGLKPVQLRGAARVDPSGHDFFREVIEQRHVLATRSDLTETERKRLDPFLKVLANSSSYGIYVEMNRNYLGGNKTEPVDVYGLERFVDPEVAQPESPGEFSFPPMAACITGAARLMLALLERCVADAGGTYAFCDTDSMAIVASETGGLVPCTGGTHQLPDGREAIQALTWNQVHRICQQFAQLNPYDPNTVPGSVLEIEDENYETESRTKQRPLYCYAISAKRYALYTLDQEGQPVLRKTEDTRMGEKWSEHGLGHLLNPLNPKDEDRDWIRTLWELEVRRALGLDRRDPDWLDQRALGQLTIGKPQTLDPFTTFNGDKPYSERVKPFNFLLTAHIPQLSAQPPGEDPAKFQLIAPYEADRTKWSELEWRNKYSATGEAYTATTDDQNADPCVVRIQSYRDVLTEYRIHLESKSLAPDGGRSGWHSKGLLKRRPVTAVRIVHIGKEANELDEIQTGTVHELDEVLNQHVTTDEWRAYVLPVLDSMSRDQLRELGISGSQIRVIRAGAFAPLGRRRARLTVAAGDHARRLLRARGVLPPGSAIDCCAGYLANAAKARPPLTAPDITD